MGLDVVVQFVAAFNQPQRHTLHHVVGAHPLPARRTAAHTPYDAFVPLPQGTETGMGFYGVAFHVV